MKVESQLILTSKNSETGANLYTFVLTYPRVILAEVNTHRMLSRNTASSRAIPSKKQREKVLNNPFVPISVGSNQKGMQAGEELTGWRRWVCVKTWELSRYPMVAASWILDKCGAHKQIVNRIVEPWTWTQQVVTCTDLKNVFKLRNHPDAEPHFHELARQMQEQVEIVEDIFNGGKKYELGQVDGTQDDYFKRRIDLNGLAGIGVVQILRPGYGEWHMPFITIDDMLGCLVNSMMRYPTEGCKKISTARCARVSYFLPENGKVSDWKRDLELCDRLSKSGHWSPFEHVAVPVKDHSYIGNFFSFKQYRKEFPQEHGGDRDGI
jgi:hypothetical protein